MSDKLMNFYDAFARFDESGKRHWHYVEFIEVILKSFTGKDALSIGDASELIYDLTKKKERQKERIMKLETDDDS